MRERLSVVLPTYNERQNIEPLLKKLLAIGAEYELENFLNKTKQVKQHKNEQNFRPAEEGIDISLGTRLHRYRQNIYVVVVSVLFRSTKQQSQTT